MRWQNSRSLPLMMLGLWITAAAQTPPADTLTGHPSDSTITPSTIVTVPDTLRPIVSPISPTPFDPRANMVWIDGREITWTLPDASGRKRMIEGPKRSTPGFYVDRMEVTNQDFAQFLSFNDSNAVYYDRRMDIVEIMHGQYRAKSGRESFPVAWVDWSAAFAFSKMAGKSLPTEDEWICAALAGRSLHTDTIQYLWNDSTRCNSLNSTGFPGRVAVASFPQTANPSGILDLAGNVAEWTLTEETSAMPGGKTHSWVVVKGGSFLDPPGSMTLFSRALRDRSERLSSVGFRCVLREQPSH